MMILQVLANRDKRFLMRLPDWIMAAMMTNIGLLLLSDPGIFYKSPVFSGLARLLDGSTMGLMCIVVGGLRLTALTAFSMFEWERVASFARAGLALLSMMAWVQLALGFWIAGAVGNAGLGKIIYPWLAVLEITNTLIAMIDAANTRGSDAGRT